MGSGFDSLMAHHITPARIIRRGGFAVFQPLESDTRRERNSDNRRSTRGRFALLNFRESTARHTDTARQFVLFHPGGLTRFPHTIRCIPFGYFSAASK